MLYGFSHFDHGYKVLLKIIVINLSTKKWTRNNTPMGMYPKTYTLKCFYTIVVMYNLLFTGTQTLLIQKVIS